jgi:hypothetical protein
MLTIRLVQDDVWMFATLSFILGSLGNPLIWWFRPLICGFRHSVYVGVYVGIGVGMRS